MMLLPSCPSLFLNETHVESRLFWKVWVVGCFASKWCDHPNLGACALGLPLPLDPEHADWAVTAPRRADMVHGGDIQPFRTDH